MTMDLLICSHKWRLDSMYVSVPSHEKKLLVEMSSGSTHVVGQFVESSGQEGERAKSRQISVAKARQNLSEFSKPPCSFLSSDLHQQNTCSKSKETHRESGGLLGDK